MSMRSSWLLPILAAAAPAQTLEVPLEWVTQPAGERPSILPATQRVPLTEQAPPGEWKLPEVEKPWFALVGLGERQHLAVVAWKDPQDPRTQRLWFDADGDGDLAEEPVLAAAPAPAAGAPAAGRVLPPRFPDLELRIRVDGVERPCRLQARLYVPAPPRTAGDPQPPAPRAARVLPADNPFSRILAGPALILASAGHYRGRLALAGRTWHFVVADNNGNGRFGDPGSLPEGARSLALAGGDLLYAAKDREPGPLDRYAFPRILGLGGRAWRVGLRQGRLVLDPVADAVAVPLPMTLTQAVLVRDGEGWGAVLLEPGRELPLPAGAYRLASYKAVKADPDGGAWTLTGTGSLALAPLVAGAAAVAPALGEPFQAKASLIPPAKEGEPARLTFQLLGAGGERVTALSYEGEGTAIPRSEKSPARPKEPAWVLLGEDGLEAARGDFKYG